MQWQDVIADPCLNDLPYKIELNQLGRIEMSPTSFIHSAFQAEIAKQLGVQLGGRVFTELAIQTTHGVKVPDVAWATDDYFQQHLHTKKAVSAPELCIEILSPSNTNIEMQNKIDLYLQAGSIEVWLVNEQGFIRFFNATGEQTKSRFKVTIKDLL
jgi:Uma2 family endonuclease